MTQEKTTFIETVRSGLLAAKPFVAKSNDAAAQKRWNNAWKALQPSVRETPRLQMTVDAAITRDAADDEYIEKLNAIGQELRRRRAA